MPTIRLVSTSTSFAAQPGETILAAALRAGIRFPYSCQAGNCGSCKCRLVSGKVSELEYSEDALSATERIDGYILACRTHVIDEAHIQHLAGSARASDDIDALY
jgi:CDP-4-dehydro-6-deoxyglucose reductase, E3